jgi:ribonuclease P protein component
MSSNTDKFFLKSARLRKRAEYLEIQHRGLKAETNAFIGLVVPGRFENARIGITATRRLGNAVTRNRIKRLVREAFRRKIMDLPARIDIVVIGKKKAAKLESQTIFDDLTILGRRVTRLMEQCQ